MSRLPNEVEEINRLERIARRVLRPSGVDHWDLVSWGWLALQRVRERFDPSRGVDLGAYAEVRIYGAMIDGLRQITKSREREFEDGEGVSVFAPEVPSAIESWDEVQALLSRLPERTRRFFVLHVHWGVTQVDIARLSGVCSATYVSTIFHKGIKMLQPKTKSVARFNKNGLSWTCECGHVHRPPSERSLIEQACQRCDRVHTVFLASRTVMTVREPVYKFVSWLSERVGSVKETKVHALSVGKKYPLCKAMGMSMAMPGSINDKHPIESLTCSVCRARMKQRGFEVPQT